MIDGTVIASAMLDACFAEGMTISNAASCTDGMIVAMLTDITVCRSSSTAAS